MKKAFWGVTALALAAATPAVVRTQSNQTATYITAEEVEIVNKQPGTDRTIRVLDIGHEHFSVGVIHRGATGGGARGAAGGGAGAAAAGAAARGGAGGGAAAAGGAGRGAAAAGAGGGAAGRGAAAAAVPCGQQMATAPASGGAAGMIAHDRQTEGYYIISGGGTLMTGGHIVNGRQTGPTDQVTTELNGPSCNGTAYGDDIIRKVVKKGDIIIIPATVPHGWTDITEEVTYLSFRPSQDVLTAGYVHPSIKK
jgi:mannose-6-phosphate isomerase-like protein (cupin superfamily)